MEDARERESAACRHGVERAGEGARAWVARASLLLHVVEGEERVRMLPQDSTSRSERLGGGSGG